MAQATHGYEKVGSMIRVLLVEDDPEDAKLLADAAKAAEGSIDLNHVDDGQKAIDYLRRSGAYAAAPRPDMVLLDLHLPKRGGIDVLNAIKKDDKLRVIPVIALTSSAESEDIWNAYAAGANCYVAKPVGTSALVDFVKLLCAFWSVAKLPPLAP